jgi:hypothetical protein
MKFASISKLQKKIEKKKKKSIKKVLDIKIYCFVSGIYFLQKLVEFLSRESTFHLNQITEISLSPPK